MATIDSQVLFITTSPRTPAKMVPEIDLLIKNFQGKVWNKETQCDFMEILREEDFYNGRGSNDPSFSARDRINRAPKSLGFVTLSPTIQITPAGEALIKARNKEEVFLRQMLKFQIPSPFHKPTAKAYDEALEITKEWYNDPQIVVGFKANLEKLFPVLKESEDERIRKDIKQHFLYLDDSFPDKAKWLNWLAKQGGQKHVEAHKFKVGKWYQCTKDFFGKGVTFDKNTAYYCAKEGCLQCKYGCHIAIVEELYDNFKLWTIQDAKDGDVLATLDYILIFKEFLKNDGGISYCHYDFGAGDPQFIWFEDKNWHFGKEAIIHPATKEQREQLEKAMTDAGYTFDFEKKELKKIEQNPVWSEEDEERIKIILSVLDTHLCWDGLTGKNKNTFSKEIDWLKSLKDKYLPQQKQEWSEEDKGTLERIISFINSFVDKDLGEVVLNEEIFTDDAQQELKRYVDFLKSLHPQKHWKPSEEQMHAFEQVYDWCNNNFAASETLTSLYQDLKKLKG